ncbi:hypothetical protein RUM44_007499 [Polyplax serrata]|uniref:Fibronectin type-III domain-containing protein n=1 Tax=Polyplax serrata TaxID=468196 RepID=A0ABR1B0U5_POLSC
MYCMQYDYYSDYYPQQDICSQQRHQHQVCTIHGDYGPVTVPMVSTNSSPPIPMPVQVPPGHLVQQIVDESGALRHVILSPSPHPMVPLPQHYGPGPASGSSQPPQPYFAAQMPPYPPHFAPMQAGVLGTAPGHSPPPSNASQHYHKDERTQRQYNKLKKKLEQKQQRADQGLSSPSYSPRKDQIINGIKLKTSSNAGVEKEKVSYGVNVPEDPEENIQDGDDESVMIVEFLSTVSPPHIIELLPRSALLSWSALSESEKNVELDIAESDLGYEVLLADIAKGGKYKSIYNGCSLSCRIEDLRPGSEYSVCLKVHLEDLQGSASEPKLFTTPSCAPDQPLPPKCISRTRNSMQLRWNAPPDNGSHITQYILESDEGKGDGFVEIFKSKSKQHNVIRLQPAMCYRFRLSAANECGRSLPSDVVMYSTCGSPPTQPAPPLLQEAFINGLKLAWNKHPADDEFTLQMDDQHSGHGFLSVYNGKDICYKVEKLTRYSEYKFRLRAQNEEGSSRWSDEVTYRTLPSRPGPPHRLSVKGRIHAHSFKVKWEPPIEKGGPDLTGYHVQICSGNGFETAYEGLETEYVVDRLNPGTVYQVRVSCSGAGGRSDPSDIISVTTESVCPGPCGPPRLHGKPRPHSLTLKFSYPEYNGGAPVTELEVEMTAPDASKRLIHRGPETECIVNDLSPGQPYLFHVRAINKAGVGPWSEGVEVLSGAAAPDPPGQPQVFYRSPHLVSISWSAPSHNGAPITDYKVDMCTSESGDFTVAYHGLNTCCEIRGLLPNTCYSFRVQATNSAGPSEYSPSGEIMMPPSAPAVVGSLRYLATPTTLALSWVAPLSHGSDITHYNIDVGDKLIRSASTDHVLHSLRPETTYRIKVQAVNGIGAGPFSQVVKATTSPLPPPPPQIECVNLGHNFIKLKWGDSKSSDAITYKLEMENPRSLEFIVIYQGAGHSYKLTRVQELTNHSFRISAANDAGQGEYSEVFQFTTAMAPPPPVKNLKVSDITQRSCSLDWQPCRLHSNDPVRYQVQISRVRNQDYKQVYRGSECKISLNDLEPGADYSVRVCPVRVSSNSELPGPFCTSVIFSTLPAATQISSTIRTTTTQVMENRQFADQQWAIIILSIFSLFAVLVAVLMQRMIDWGAHN